MTDVPNILLDTCAVIWLAHGDKLADEAVALLTKAAERGAPSYISPISAWEIGLLVSKQRLQLGTTPERWFSHLFNAPLVNLAEMPPHILIAASFLPGKAPRDPADRIIAATARDLGATIITRDRALLDYGSEGHIRTTAC
jgi:PIN domain nuclease of toxin-antitoxin system